ncbi:hypothetical protein SAMN06295909_3665 [Plantibacter sp. VKM Ac-1784]|uniref:Uncharacterized protein n=1 Tax=Plantibacter elymi (nom. nud.) TaxID=199708 RepID=A0ABY1RIE2_9MICO|nr:hypothetical protein SAMN06295909_3665 [Plantibacter sp. VKM Ac-1784]
MTAARRASTDALRAVVVIARQMSVYPPSIRKLCPTT